MKKTNTAALLAIGGILCLASFAAAAEIGPAAAVTAPKVTGPVAVTADSFPLLAASRQLVPLDLAKVGYVEQEFIMSGNANVYDWNADGSVSVKTPNAPYTTRVLVRRPADASKFSGHVVVEPLFTARRFDWAMIDGYVRDSIIERGDAWVGVTLPAAVKALQKFNPTRYASLSYANPNPTEACAAGPNAPPATADVEDGLRWDAISQAGVAMKNGSLGFKAQYIYLTTQGGDIQTYAAAINPHTSFENKPVYDGFVLKSPGGPGRIRRCAPAIPRTDVRNAIKNIGVPMILVAAQGEVAEGYRRPDSDDKADAFRIYEFAGAAHIDTWAYRELPNAADQQAATGVPMAGTPEWPFAFRCDNEMLLQDHPLEKYVLDSTFANLEQWVAKGVAPPKAERIQMKDGKVVTDQYGNGLGGIRSPYVDVPVATYVTSVAGPGNCREFGRTESFDWAKRESLYGSQKGYVAKVGQSVDTLVKERWLTASDAAKIKTEAAGLK